MTTFRLAASVCFLFAALTAAFAQTPPPDADLTANPIFEKNCAKCHGKTAEGRHFGGPSLISEKTSTTAADDLRNLITNGKGRMPKFSGKLTADEIDTLVQQIKTAGRSNMERRASSPVPSSTDPHRAEPASKPTKSPVVQ